MSKISGVCTDAALSMMKHTDHLSRLAYLEIRRISSVRHLLTTKATAQLMIVFFCSHSVGLLQLFAHWHQLTVIRCTGCRKFKTTQRTLFLTWAEHYHVRPLLTALHWLPVKDGIIFKIAIFLFSVLVFNFDGTPPPYLSSCLSVIHSSDSTFQFRWKKQNTLSCARWKFKGFVAGRSLLRLPLSGTTFLLTSDTAVLSHSSTLLSNLFSLLLPALNYSNPFTGIGYCTWFDLDFAADVITGWLIFLFFRFSFLGWGWEVERDCEREGKARGCQIVCMWVWGCVCVYAGEWEG